MNHEKPKSNIRPPHLRRTPIVEVRKRRRPPDGQPGAPFIPPEAAAKAIERAKQLDEETP